MKKYVFIGILIIILIVSGVAIYIINNKQVPNISESEIPSVIEFKIEEVSEDKMIETNENEVAEIIEDKVTEETTQVASVEPKKDIKQETKQIKETTSKSDSQTKKEDEQPPIISSSSLPTLPIEQEKIEIEEKHTEVPKTEHCTTIDNHGTEVGHSKNIKTGLIDVKTGWYNTKANAIAVYTAKVNEGSTKWGNYEITTQEYERDYPDSYEIWTCYYCKKWTINFIYK